MRLATGKTRNLHHDLPIAKLRLPRQEHAGHRALAHRLDNLKTEKLIARDRPTCGVVDGELRTLIEELLDLQQLRNRLPIRRKTIAKLILNDSIAGRCPQRIL